VIPGEESQGTRDVGRELCVSGILNLSHEYVPLKEKKKKSEAERGKEVVSSLGVAQATQAELIKFCS
jgi:hypothetical protein